jgi:hypothetical protein
LEASGGIVSAWIERGQAHFLCTNRREFSGRISIFNGAAIDHSAMGFNRRKMEDQHRQTAERESAGLGNHVR